MKKVIVYILTTFMIFMSACTTRPEKSEDKNPPAELDYVTRIVSENGRTYIDYRGKPFLMLGGQIRVDGLMNRGEGEFSPVAGAPAAFTAEEIEPYIRRASEFGLTVVELPVDWRDIEPEMDRYDFSVPDTLLKLCNKYDVKAEFLWFSTNMCGDSHSFHIPDYIWEDEVTYPKLDSAYNYFNWMYGFMGHLVLDNPNLMEREGKALKALLDHVYEWNEQNGKKYPLIGIQIHNEPDGLVRWRSSQAQLLERNDMTYADLWKMTLNALNNAGMAAKTGKYKIYTRCNMTVSFNMDEFSEAKGCSPKDVYDLDGIDIVGDDPYTTSTPAAANVIRSYTYEMNYPHIAENMGNYDNTASLMLAAVTNGGGYAIYDFITPQYFNFMNEYQGSSYQMDQGVLNDDFSEKPHSADAERTVKGLAIAAEMLASVKLEAIAGLNIESDKPEKLLEKNYTIDGITLGFFTENGAKGYMFTDGKAVYIFTDEAAILDFYSVGTSKAVYSGRFSGQEFVNEGKSYIVGTKLIAEGNKLYKVELK